MRLRTTSAVKALSQVVSGVLALTLAASAIACARTELAAGCAVEYAIRSQWRDGFTADVRVTNRGAAIAGWRLSWAFADGQRLASGWNGDWSQTGDRVTVRGIENNARLDAGSSASVGFHARRGAANAAPAQFLLDGVVCSVRTASAAGSTFGD